MSKATEADQCEDVRAMVCNALPELPQSEYSAWLRHGKKVSAFARAHSPVATRPDGAHWMAKGYESAPLYTADQMREYAAAAQSDALRRLADVEQERDQLREKLKSRAAARERARAMFRDMGIETNGEG